MKLSALSWMYDHYGSKKGYIKHLWYSSQYWLGCRFGTNWQDERRILRVVYVCKGNICRSALAAVVSSQASSIAVHSFGLDTHDGKPANRRFSERALSYGIDLQHHLTTSFNSFCPQKGDLYVCMEPWQSKKLRNLIPNSNITLLGFYGKSLRPYLHDPYSSNHHYLEFSIRYIEACVQEILRKTR